MIEITLHSPVFDDVKTKKKKVYSVMPCSLIYFLFLVLLCLFARKYPGEHYGYRQSTGIPG